MPIRINLLAESQALEEMRRRDPVKRAIWVGVLVVSLLLAYSISLQFKAVIASSELGRLNAQIAAHTNEFQRVQVNQKKLADVNQKLGALLQLSTNRFLNGTVLNALQQTMVDDVHLVRFRADEGYVLVPETPKRTNEDRVIPGKPATVTERITLTLEARDTSASPGDQAIKFKGAFASSPYFQKVLGKTNEVRLKDIGAVSPSPDGRFFMPFALECRFPDKTR